MAHSSAEDDLEQPFIAHLLELRDRLLRMILGIAVIFAIMVPFSNRIYSLVSKPVREHLLHGSQMIATGTVTPFLVPLKLVLALSFFVALPWVLYQLWAFIAPGLYRHEKTMVLPLVVSSTVLFYCGMAFAYFALLPLFSAFMAGTTPAGVNWMPDINVYLSFVLTLFFAFGVAFEMPIATILLCLAGATTPAALSRMRPYIVVVIFAIAAVLTPPDIISQTILAVPMWLLFESGVFMSRIMLRRREQRRAAEEDAGSEDGDDS